MAFKAHTAVGLSKPLYLPDDIVFETKIIPADRDYVRSNTKRSASVVKFVTRHETANFNVGADAEMHYRWLMSNVGNDPGNAAGYNCVSDDHKIIHMTPYDEVTWAAGTYTGNLTGDHHELCVNSGVDHAKARRIAAALDAAVLYARGLPVSSLIQHNYWTGKNCPLLMRRDGVWPSYVQQATAFYNGIKAQVENAPAPAPVTQYPAARPIDVLKDSRPFLITDGGSTLVRADLIVKTTKATPRLMYADASSERIGPDIGAGSEFAVDYIVLNPDGSRFWYTPWGTRVKYEDTTIVRAE